jgi:hypothetical protein
MFGKMLNEIVTLRKIVLVVQDTTFNTTSETATDYAISAEIQPITLEELTLLAPGPFIVGDAKGFFAPFYVVQGVVVTVEPGDRVITSDKTVTYLVFKVLEYRVHGKPHHRECILRRKD